MLSSAKRFIGVGVAGLVSTWATPSLAQEKEAPSVAEIRAAESDFTKGRDAFKAGNYGEAAEFFESADTHAPNERVLELALTARDQAGHLDRAATLAELALRRYPKNLSLAELARPILDRAEQELLRVDVVCDEPCSLLNGSRLVHGQPSLERTIFLKPGPHSIRAGWSEDRTRARNVEGAAGDTLEIAFVAPDLPPPQPPVERAGPPPREDGMADRPPPPASEGLPPTVFWIGAGLTAAVGGVTIWSGVDTLENPGQDAVRDQCVGQGADCPLYQDGRERQTRTNLLLGATGVVGVATIVVGAFLTDWSGNSSDAGRTGRPKVAISPWIGAPHGPTLGASGRF